MLQLQAQGRGIVHHRACSGFAYHKTIHTPVHLNPVFSVLTPGLFRGVYQQIHGITILFYPWVVMPLVWGDKYRDHKKKNFKSV